MKVKVVALLGNMICLSTTMNVIDKFVFYDLKLFYHDDDDDEGS